MIAPVAEAARWLEDVRPLVRSTDSQLEVTLLPPYGDPEVHIPGEVGTYVLAGLLLNTLTERLHEE